MTLGPDAVTGYQISTLVGTQAMIWVSIILIVVTIATVCTLMGMDADKERDTMLYAKFLTNVKDK